MRAIKIFGTGVFLCAFFLSACGRTTELKVVETPELLPVGQTFETSIPTEGAREFETEYVLKIRTSDLKLSKYEPEYGCYLGANVQSDKIIDRKIASFERAVGVENAIYGYEMVSGGEFPEKWFLECVARMKTPSVTIYPPGKTDLYNMELITKTAQETGAYNLPVFIHLYPYSKEAGFTAKDYADFYKKARAVFAQYAPNAAFVWDVYFEDVYDCSAFYPGDATDWVGLNVRLDVATDGTYKDARKYIDYFYYNYQKLKPVMLSELAISHFTTENNAYYTDKAVAEIKKLYGLIGKSLPRLKAIIYMDANLAEPDVSKNAHDYSIAGEDLLKQAYRQSVSGGNSFLSQIETEKPLSPHIVIQSPFPAYYKNSEYYVAHKTLEYDAGVNDLRLLEPKAVLILGEKYYSMGTVYGFHAIDFFVDNEKNVIVLELKK